MLSLNHKTLIGGFAALIFFPIVGLSVDAQAFCVYNKLSNKKHTIEAKRSHTYLIYPGQFKKKIKPGKHECCHYTNRDCRGGRLTAAFKSAPGPGLDFYRTSLIVIEVKGGKLPGQGRWPKRGACGFTAGGWIEVYDNKMVCYSVRGNGDMYDSCSVPPGKNFNIKNFPTVGSNYCVTKEPWPGEGWGVKVDSAWR